MPIDPYKAMQDAVDIVATSPHPTNKIAATLFTDQWSITKTNFWPEQILAKIGENKRIGNSSGTIHAETACILDAPSATKGASLCVTDPFCPNCAKNIAEAGITTIYIDHKGFDKDFFKRRSNHFDSMSMQVCERASINVYQLWRKEQRLTPILEAPNDFFPKEDSPAEMERIEQADEKTFAFYIEKASQKHKRRKFSLCFVEDEFGARHVLIVRSHAVRGYTMSNQKDVGDIEQPSGKYSFIQEPVNRLLMTISRRGLRLIDGFLYCNQVPTSREQVNLVGAEINRITIGDMTKSRDTDALRAMKILSRSAIIRYT